MRTRYEGQVWNDRFLPRLTTEEIAKLPKDNAILILPIASVEQHGNHLPVFTDSLLNEALIEGALALLPKDSAAWLLPPLQYGKSNEHTGFSGTFSLSTAALQAVLADLTRSMHADGWKRLIIVNSHGGNPEIIALAARDARVELGLQVYALNTAGLYEDEALSAREMEYGIHGGALETSLMLAVKPDWVRPERYLAEYPTLSECSCFKLGGDVSVAWATRDLSNTGVIGDPTASTEEIGSRMYKRITRRMADIFLEAISHQMPLS
ncbi:creatininase family protein [Paenibacillaceae bacterium WGS1546]|uniref:creatininase family protein n=1 Tax=Cohnella sp. WGS1546 TaxID=3366810 RepID=UPI00372D2EBE